MGSPISTLNLYHLNIETYVLSAEMNHPRGWVSVRNYEVVPVVYQNSMDVLHHFCHRYKGSARTEKGIYG